MMTDQDASPERPRVPTLELVPRPRDRLTASGEREVGKIVADVWENAEKLVRQELELGLAEIDRRVDKLKTGLLTATIGGATLYAGVLVLLAAAVLGLASVMVAWLAALIVGVVATSAGAVLCQRGGSKPEEAVKLEEHLDRTVSATKEAVK